MGRELKRVPLDFAHPVGKTWDGYLNHFYDAAIPCPHCDGTGSSPDAIRLKDLWYGYAPFNPEDRGSVPFTPGHPAIQHLALRNRGGRHEAERLCNHFNGSWMYHVNADDVAALVEANRLHDFTHTWTKGEGWKPKDPAYIPTPQEVNEWSIRGFGHDCINQWVVIEAECKRLGVPTQCEHCQGESETWPSEEAKKAYDGWTRTEPPTGDGYQIWETVSEGSPISPVFATPEELASHMAGTRWGADKGTPYETWLAFINGPGWAPSLVSDDKGLREGVAAVVDR